MSLVAQLKLKTMEFPVLFNASCQAASVPSGAARAACAWAQRGVNAPEVTRCAAVSAKLCDAGRRPNSHSGPGHAPGLAFPGRKLF